METTKRQLWHLKARDFDRAGAYAEQDWRYQMFFEYLRISPSYALAHVSESEADLAARLSAPSQAASVWKARQDFGDVYACLYREWWLQRGIKLLGIQTARPSVEKVARVDRTAAIADSPTAALEGFLNNQFLAQGHPDSLLVSIPLGLKRATIIKQLKQLLDEEGEPQQGAVATYTVEKNKMRQSRLLAGLRLVYMRAARPEEELWRVATRAKISRTHRMLDPSSPKKDAKSAQSRRMLTILASRLLHDTLVIAENAAHGRFPSLEPVLTVPFEFTSLGARLRQVRCIEKGKQAALLIKAGASNVK